jgi:hypothetical protein
MDYPDSVYIYTSTETEDDSGSQVITFALQGVECCRVQPVSAREVIRSGMGVQGDIIYNFYFDSDVTINTKDRIEYDSSTFEIIECVKYPSTYIRCLGRRVY